MYPACLIGSRAVALMGSLKDKTEFERAREIMESVEAQCFISNSIKSKVSLAPEFVVAPSLK
jgi:organic hydroperoxide reductase OsmC/OhrA